MPDTTPRIKFPYLSSGQAQKEVTHNEALLIADMLVQPVVEALGQTSVPPSPQLGQCWVVGAGAGGDWTGKVSALACWTDGGWRFFVPFEGMAVWSIADSMQAQWHGGGWIKGGMNALTYAVEGQVVVRGQRPAIATPTGGATTDNEARIAVNAILAALRGHGLIAT
jgi:Protein of unknown function (DUF2793)